MNQDTVIVGLWLVLALLMGSILFSIAIAYSLDTLKNKVKDLAAAKKAKAPKDE